MSQNQARILVVDDEPDNRFIIEEYLEDNDYLLTMAADGETAWQLLQNEDQPFDVILLDIMMPGMSGLELLDLIKQTDHCCHTPVILQTAKSSTEDIAKGIQAGAFYYLTKPFNAEVLASMVQTALNDSRRYQQIERELANGVRSFGMMKSGVFEFRTLEEGHVIIQLLAQACPNPSKIGLGLSELLINAIEHGNLEIDYRTKSELIKNKDWDDEISRRQAMDKYAERRVEVEYCRSPTHIRFTITDQGAGFDWQPFMQISADRGGDNHGRGIAMANLLSFDSVEYQGRGNQVIATLNLEPDPKP